MCANRVIALAVTGLLVGSSNYFAIVHRAGLSDFADEAKVGMVSRFIELVFIRNTADPLESTRLWHFPFCNIVPVCRTGHRFTGKRGHSVEGIRLSKYVAVSRPTGTLILNSELFWRHYHYIFRSESVREDSQRQGGRNSVVLDNNLDVAVNPGIAAHFVRGGWSDARGRIYANPRTVTSKETLNKWLRW